MVGFVLRAAAPVIHAGLGIFLPLITTNCAVLGVALLNVRDSTSFLDSVLFGLGAALGFSLVLVMFTCIRERLSEDRVPRRVLAQNAHKRGAEVARADHRNFLRAGGGEGAGAAQGAHGGADAEHAWSRNGAESCRLHLRREVRREAVRRVLEHDVGHRTNLRARRGGCATAPPTTSRERSNLWSNLAPRG